MRKKDNSIVNSINPLNLKNSYDDNVMAFKVLISLSNSEELKLLGMQIIDSFILLNLIKDSKLLKKIIPSYNSLVNSLSVNVNKYSKFEKILRKEDIKTGAFLSDKFMFITDLKNSFSLIGLKSKKVVNSTKSYIVIDKSINDFKDGYSLNTILNQSKLFKSILCRDNKFSSIKSNNSNKLVLSPESDSLI